ncbi:MAG: hypothetical protein AAGJ70_14400 [Pseudomonadota bacterium]
MTPTDEDLLAHLDGRLDADARRAVALAVQADPRVRERLHVMEASGAALRAVAAPDSSGLEELEAWVRAHAATGDVETGARPQRLTHQSSSWVTQLAACFVTMMLGGGLGYLIGTQETFNASEVSRSATAAQPETPLPTWMVRVVDYHTLYARDTLVGTAADRPATAKLEDRLSRSLARQVHIPDLDGRRLTFHRGQLLRFRDVPVAQLAYLPQGNGTPVALCLKPTTEKDSKPVLIQFRGMNVVRWRADGLSFVIVGHRDGPTLLADAIAAQAKIKAARDI